VGQTQEVTLPDKDGVRQRQDGACIWAKNLQRLAAKSLFLRQVIVTQAVTLPCSFVAGAPPGDFDIVQKATLPRPDICAAAKQ